MKYRNSILLLTALLITAVYACKKKESTTDTTPTPTKTQKDYLQEGKWQITSIRYSSLAGSGDACDTMPACRKDNMATFNANGKIYSDEGATKCSSSSPQVDSSGTWSLTSDYKKLTANVSWVPTSNKTFEVLELTSTVLKLAQTFDTVISIPPFPAYTFTIKDTVTAKNVN
jgi:hypothetical protein